MMNLSDNEAVALVFVIVCVLTSLFCWDRFVGATTHETWLDMQDCVTDEWTLWDRRHNGAPSMQTQREWRERCRVDLSRS
jgi:hypothetical protein